MAEATLSQRASLILRSNLSQLLTRFENPAKEIDIIIYDMKRDYAKLKEKSMVPFGEEESAKQKLAKFEKDMNEWKQAATNAVKAGKEESGKKCFDNYQAAKKRFESQQATYERLHSQCDVLRQQMSQIIDEINQMEAKAGEIKAMSAAADATEMVSDMHSGLSSGRHKSMFDKMEAKAAGRYSAAQASASLTMAMSKDPDEDLKNEFLGTGDTAFEEFMASVRG